MLVGENTCIYVFIQNRFYENIFHCSIYIFTYFDESLLILKLLLALYGLINILHHLIPGAFLFLIGSYCSVTKSCLTLWDPMNCILPSSSVRGSFPGKKTEVGCHFLLRGSSQFRNQTGVSCIGRQILFH